MLTLNSQRKAFLAMVAWSEGTDNGRQSLLQQISARKETC